MDSWRESGKKNGLVMGGVWRKEVIMEVGMGGWWSHPLQFYSLLYAAGSGRLWLLRKE